MLENMEAAGCVSASRTVSQTSPGQYTCDCYYSLYASSYRHCLVSYFIDRWLYIPWITSRAVSMAHELTISFICSDVRAALDVGPHPCECTVSMFFFCALKN